ncbi:MAG: ABC-2 transporter permease [Oscillospiraceae bacterium]|nr:ABC-2 transporter permease [Oscillospiraceae bacterium]
MSITNKIRQITSSSSLTGLLYKDMLYFTSKPFILLYIAAVILSLIPMMRTTAYDVIIAAVVLSFGADSTSRWTRTASYLPFSPADVVRAKYISTYGLLGALSIVAQIMQLILLFVTGDPEFGADMLTAVNAICYAVGITALVIPVMLFFIKRSTMYNIVFVLVLILAISGNMTLSVLNDEFACYPELTLIALVIAAIAVVVSYKVSKYIYSHSDKI